MFPSDLPGIDVDDALERLQNNTELFRTILGMFCREKQDAAAEIRQAIADGDQEHAARLVHTLKGMSANISARRLADTALKLETALHSSSPAIPTFLEELEDHVAEVLRCEAMLEQSEPGETAPCCEQPEAHQRLEPMLTRLRSLLLEQNLQAQNAFREAAQALPRHGVLEEKMRRLGHSIERLDYGTAVQTVDSLLRTLSDDL